MSSRTIREAGGRSSQEILIPTRATSVMAATEATWPLCEMTQAYKETGTRASTWNLRCQHYRRLDVGTSQLKSTGVAHRGTGPSRKHTLHLISQAQPSMGIRLILRVHHVKTSTRGICLKVNALARIPSFLRLPFPRTTDLSVVNTFPQTLFERANAVFRVAATEITRPGRKTRIRLRSSTPKIFRPLKCKPNPRDSSSSTSHSRNTSARDLEDEILEVCHMP